jgi:3-dehydroquinate dehydratase I
MKLQLSRNPQIVGCIGSAAQFRRCAQQPPRDCDVLEVRLDLTGLCGGRWIEWCAQIQARKIPVLLTIRDEAQGGQWQGREAERLALYLTGLKAVAAVDVEIGAHGLDLLMPAAHKRGVVVIGSFHDFKGTPAVERLRQMEERGRRMGADIVKLATRTDTPEELARLYALPAGAKGPICVMGMGRLGGVSRVALPCAGSCLVYGALGQATAPGQLPCRQLARELARWGMRKT